MPKFASVKLIVFATFWQSMAISLMHAFQVRIESRLCYVCC
eukprot:COSAG06_NODE_3693_length_4999_cov_204.219388_8_plen_41_part_00